VLLLGCQRPWLGAGALPYSNKIGGAWLVVKVPTSRASRAQTLRRMRPNLRQFPSSPSFNGTYRRSKRPDPPAWTVQRVPSDRPGANVFREPSVAPNPKDQNGSHHPAAPIEDTVFKPRMKLSVNPDDEIIILQRLKPLTNRGLGAILSVRRCGRHGS
jgi:hypothetical protein